MGQGKECSGRQGECWPRLMPLYWSDPERGLGASRLSGSLSSGRGMRLAPLQLTESLPGMPCALDEVVLHFVPAAHRDLTEARLKKPPGALAYRVSSGVERGQSLPSRVVLRPSSPPPSDTTDDLGDSPGSMGRNPSANTVVSGGQSLAGGRQSGRSPRPKMAHPHHAQCYLQRNRNIYERARSVCPAAVVAGSTLPCFPTGYPPHSSEFVYSAFVV